MIRPFSLFAKSRRRTIVPLLPAVPAGIRLYVVGDIHGRADLLGTIGDLIRNDLESSPPSQARTIFLGDYIDRGPDSSSVLELLSTGRIPGDVTFLRGNHEAMLLGFIDDPEVLEIWRRNGGMETLLSYHVPISDSMRGLNYGEARAGLLNSMPVHHRQFVEATETSWSCGDYYFCHAGVRPGVLLDRQNADDLMWIRDEFLRSRENFGKVIVHGHTPKTMPDFSENRIGIDTGAFLTGNLTCLVLEGASRRVLSTARHGAHAL